MDIKIKAKVKAGASAEQIFQTLLSSRGYKTKKQQEEFLHPPAPTFDYLLKESGMRKAVLAKAEQILNSHLTKNHDILVFGDYDADGVTATAIMWQAVVGYAKFKHSSSRVLPFIPDRHRHGYGLSAKAVTDIMSKKAFANTQFPDFSPQLIITVDTGIVAHTSIEIFHLAGVDTIITDHHVTLSTLPEANCIVHSCETSGAGLAWIFSLSLLGPAANKLLDLSTIGVVGDMLPLVGLNRALVASGLKALSLSHRPGLVAMKKIMGISDKSLTTYDISFGIAPRINAAGRIYNPFDALRLLCTSDDKQAQILANQIESHNKDRQEFTDRALQSLAHHASTHQIIIVLGDYHEGIIGLVAGKLIELFHKPTIVMSDNGQVIKGSARSLSGINITALLRSLDIPFLGLGGHELAAGFSLYKKDVVRFTSALETIADQTISPSLLVKEETVDLALPLSAATQNLARLLHTLEPFGIGNPKPRFLLPPLTVISDRRMGEGGKHRKLTICDGEITRELVWFNSQAPYPLTTLSTVICTLDNNTWQGKTTVQLIASYVEI